MRSARRVNVQGPDAFDATLQNPIIDAVVASGPDAILVAPNDVEASAGPLERAQEAGIEVILVDTTVNDESIGASRIASDNFQGGVTAADALAEMIGEEGTVMVISVNPGISSTDARQAGFEEQIATYPDIEYIGTEFSNNEPARAAEIVTATLAANPDLNGVFAANLFSAQGTATGLVQAGAQEDVQRRRLRRRGGAGRAAAGRRRPGARRPEAVRHRLPGCRAGGRRGERR